MVSPVLDRSVGEQRKAGVLEMMDERGLDCLILGGEKGSDYQFYLTNTKPRPAALLSKDGELIVFWRRRRRLDNMASAGVDLWVDKIVDTTAKSEAIIAEIGRIGADDGRIGSVGLTGPTVLNPDGWIPYTMWSEIRDAFPNAAFEDVTREYAERMLPRTEPEIEALEKAAAAGERQCEVLLNEIKPGSLDNHLYAEVVAESYRAGAAFFHMPNWVLAPGGESLEWGIPRWVHRGYPKPRPIEKGDVLLTEFFPYYAGMNAQEQLTVGVEPLHEDTVRAGELAEEALEAGRKAAEPGVSFGAVCDAMEAPILDEGAGWLTPLLHTLNPIFATSRTRVNIDTGPTEEADTQPESENTEKHRNGDLTLKEGMVLEYESNAVIGRRRVNVGGTFVVTDDGVRALEELPLEFHSV